MLAVIATAGAQASSITITFDMPNQVGMPGQTLQFSGVITNTTSDAAPIYLNSDSFNFALGGANYTLADGFANTPASLMAGQSSGDIVLFSITLANPFTGSLGTPYLGTYGLIGGEDGGSGTGNDNLGQASFSVTVRSATSTVPEPGITVLLGLGLAALFATFRFRRQQQI